MAKTSPARFARRVRQSPCEGVNDFFPSTMYKSYVYVYVPIPIRIPSCANSRCQPAGGHDILVEIYFFCDPQHNFYVYVNSPIPIQLSLYSGEGGSRGDAAMRGNINIT